MDASVSGRDVMLHAIILCFTLLVVLRYLSTRPLSWPLSHFPNVEHTAKGSLLGAVKIKRGYVNSIKSLLDEGYKRYKTTAFVIQTSDLPRLVLPTKYLDELRSLPESIISHRKSVNDRFLGFWTGLDAVSESTLHNEICQTTLVQNLPKLLPEMAEEALDALKNNMNTALSTTNAYVPIHTYGIVFNVIARINSRVLVGEPLCRDPHWLKAAEGFPQDSVSVATDLRPYPPTLRWLVYPFLASTKRLKADYAIGLEKLRPLIASRREQSTKHHEGGKMEKPGDVLQWMIDMGTGNDRNANTIVRKMMFLTMAGFHAPTATAIHVLYDLCAYPEFVAPLRKEIEDELAAEGGRWTLNLLHRLKRLDSVLKESQRLNAPGLLGFNRKVIQSYTLSDGTCLPRGVLIALPVHHITHDQANWEEPDRFLGFRFFEKRLAEPQSEAQYQFAALGANSLAFGYGRFACPGRVFAAAQLKLLLAILLSQYDFCFEEEVNKCRRPDNIFMDDMVLPDSTVKVLFKKRS